ncbi:MAG: acyl-CoA dehydrogenase family protein [Acidimicrobiales bacterium]|nr:acyl-CoA dehydrogenase family protein [Acidimicrobiales bacterium]MDG1845055.1 acyl-CoA dehydrogenase family protein [Acidimicrobiales bacterium]
MTSSSTDIGAVNDEERQLIQIVEEFLKGNDPTSVDNKEFRGARYDAGLAWVHFPKGEGGLGVRPNLQRVVERRMREAGAQPTDPTTFFMSLAGPTVVTHGTADQKKKFLRPMFTGEERWCQLFSEPGAGSDFAGLACKAEKDGEEWVISGQKVWNTLAHLGHWGMLVTRSNPELPKHKGMTYFALDMRAEGVEVRPLRQITGEAEFNEVYLTEVRVPDSCRIGEVGEGWRVALTTLMNERTAIGGSSGGTTSKPGAGPISDAIEIWRNLPEQARNKQILNEMMSLWIKAEVLRLTNKRASSASKAGNPGPEGSIGKLASAELNKAIYELCLNMMGPAGQVGYDYTFRRPELLSTDGSVHGPRHAFLRVRANSIEGGTSEIMRNILGEQVLGLPGEPRLDKKIPWSDVPKS